MFIFIDIIDFFFKIWFYFTVGCRNTLNSMKYSVFNRYLISYAIFNLDENKFLWIYNYDKPWSIIYMYFLYILGFDTHNNLISVEDDINNLVGEHYIIVGSYILNKTQKYIMADDFNIINLSSEGDDKIKEKFIYVTLDESCDLTHEFEKFKYFILFNKYLQCRDFVTIMQLFFNNNETIKDDSVLKLMIDNTYDEKIYKGKDLLLIN
jgi:hypothetical protein